MTTVTINNHEQCYVEQMMLINQGLGPPKKRGLIRRTAGTIGGAIGGGIKGALGGGLKGAAVGGIGGTVLGGPVGGAAGAAAGGVGGGIVGGLRGMGKGIRHGARKYATPKVIHNEEHPMRTIVTVNNRDQLAVEQQMLVNQLVDNGMGNLLRAGKIMAKRGVMKAGRKATSVGGVMKTQARAAGIQAKRGGLRAGNFAHKNPKTSVAAAGLGGAAVGAAIPRRKQK